jgi:outer membrane immunogenic protein
MRRFLLAAMMFGAVSSAHAADMPDLPVLRGGFSQPVRSWSGGYIGGQVGYGSSDENFNGSTGNMTSALLADTLIESAMQVSQWNLGLGKESQRSSSYGAFAGYNTQWEDVVLGVEANYMHGSFGGFATASEARSSGTALSDGLIHDVTATSQAGISISDMATFRGRAGYVFGCFLPYMFGGLALANADISRSVLVQDAGFIPLSASNVQHNHLVYGYSGGLGADIRLSGGLFLRAEWEYARFTDQIDISINTLRAGLGYKF